eukprot:g65944.t1
MVVFFNSKRMLHYACKKRVKKGTSKTANLVDGFHPRMQKAKFCVVLRQTFRNFETPFCKETYGLVYTACDLCINMQFLPLCAMKGQYQRLSKQCIRKKRFVAVASRIQLKFIVNIQRIGRPISIQTQLAVPQVLFLRCCPLYEICDTLFVIILVASGYDRNVVSVLTSLISAGEEHAACCALSKVALHCTPAKSRWSCHVMSGHVMSCQVRSCQVRSCHVRSCHVMSGHVMSCHVISCHIMQKITKELIFQIKTSISVTKILKPPRSTTLKQNVSTVASSLGKRL